MWRSPYVPWIVVLPLAATAVAATAPKCAPLTLSGVVSPTSTSLSLPSTPGARVVVLVIASSLTDTLLLAPTGASLAEVCVITVWWLTTDPPAPSLIAIVKLIVSLAPTTLKVSGAHFGAVADTAVAASGKTTIHGTYGDLHIATDGTYDYTPNTAAAEALPQGQAASDVFTYTVTDVHGASGTATLTFNITGQEAGPAAVTDTVAATEDVAASAATRASGLLGNDTDVDTGETATLKVSGAHFGAVADH